MYHREKLKSLLLILFAGVAAAGPVTTQSFTGTPCDTTNSSLTGFPTPPDTTSLGSAFACYNPPGIGSLPASSCEVTFG